MTIIINGYSYPQIQLNASSLLNNATIDFTGKKVSDNIRGYVFFNTQSNVWEFSLNNLSQNTKLKKVALILESPHKDEFDIYYRPLLPANGLTGKKIYEKLGSKMNNKALLNRSFVYEIYIINPVQYQCSLYHELEIKDFGAHIYGATTHCRKLTNKVFRCLFGSAKHPTDIQLDFQARLCTYNPDIILNCCTYGLKKLVDGAIHSKTILLDHPSRW